MKKLAKKVLGFMLTMVMVLICFTACDKEGNSAGYVFDENKPLKYYQSIEQKSIDNAVQKLDETFAKMGKVSNVAQKAINSSATVKVDPELVSMLTGTELPFNFQSVKVNGTMNYKQDKGFNVVGDILLNDQTILNVESVFDQVEKMIYFKIPDLCDKYLYLSLEDLEKQLDDSSDGIDDLDVGESPISISEMDIRAFNDINVGDITALYKKCAKIIVDATEKAEIEKDATLDVNGQSVKCKKLVSSLNSEQLNKALEEILSVIKSDETVDKIVKAYGISKEDFDTELDNAIEEIKSEETDNSELVIEVYINDNNDIIGRKLFEKGNEDNYFKYGVAECDDGKSVTEISFADDEEGSESFNMIIDSTTTDGVSNGTVTVTNDENEFVVEFKNVSCSDEKVAGEFSIDLTTLAQIPATLVTKIDATTDNQSLFFSFNMNDKEYVSVEFTSENTEFSDFDIPEVDEAKDYNVSDEKAMAAFGEEAKANLVNLLDKIATALGTDLQTLMQLVG